MLLMPDNIQWDILRIISLPVMTIFPFATVLVGQLTVRSAQRKLARQRLAQSEEEYRLLTETSNDMIVIRDVSGIISFANRKARELLGLSDASVGKVLATDYVRPDYYHFNRFCRTRSGYQNHRLFTRRSGTIGSNMVEVSSTPCWKTAS